MHWNLLYGDAAIYSIADTYQSPDFSTINFKLYLLAAPQQWVPLYYV